LLKFHKLLFLMSKWILKNKIIIQHPNAKLENVLQYLYVVMIIFFELDYVYTFLHTWLFQTHSIRNFRYY
jgi:hypothetical protein